MRKTLLLVSFLVVLTAPAAMAAQRDDGPGDRRGFIGRIVRLVHALEDIIAGPPHP